MASDEHAHAKLVDKGYDPLWIQTELGKGERVGKFEPNGMSA